MDFMIELNGLTKSYGVMPILRGVNLQLQAGEFVTLVGANGAGKSTLLSILATLSKPTGGTVSIGGWQLPQQAQRVRQHIGLVSHHSLLYRDLSAEDNLEFFARLYNLKDRKAVVAAALKRVGLTARSRDSVRTFSRGMIQRLTIARATLHQPDVLLLDEPYTGLDQSAGRLLDDLLQRERELGRTILLITHNLLRGYTLADRVAILNRGKIVREIERATLSDNEFMQIYQETIGT